MRHYCYRKKLVLERNRFVKLSANKFQKSCLWYLKYLSEIIQQADVKLPKTSKHNHSIAQDTLNTEVKEVVLVIQTVSANTESKFQSKCQLSKSFIETIEPYFLKVEDLQLYCNDSWLGLYNTGVWTLFKFSQYALLLMLAFTPTITSWLFILVGKKLKYEKQINFV